MSNKEDVENALPANFFKFSTWLIRNRNTESIKAVRSKITELNIGDKPIAIDALIKLWDNLFYQVVTQQSFAIKEAVMQVLLAKHVVDRLSKNIDTSNDVLFAKVLLPKE